MNKSRFLLFAFVSAMLAITFVGCGKDDTGPQDHPLTDKGVFTSGGGVFNGHVTIKNSTTGSPKTEDASVKFTPGDNNGLQMTINDPTDFTPVTCTNFMESGDKTVIWCTMSAQPYTFVGSEVPSYYIECFGSISEITRVVIKSYSFEYVVYDVEMQALGITCSVTADVYTIDQLTGVEGVMPAYQPTVSYTFENLKK